MLAAQSWGREFRSPAVTLTTTKTPGGWGGGSTIKALTSPRICLFLRSHIKVEDGNQLPKADLLPPHVACIHTHKHTHTLMINK